MTTETEMKLSPHLTHKHIIFASEWCMEEMSLAHLGTLAASMEFAINGAKAGTVCVSRSSWTTRIKVEGWESSLERVRAEIARRTGTTADAVAVAPATTQVQVQEQQQEQQQVQVLGIARLCAATGCINEINPNSKSDYCLFHSNWHGLD